MCAAVATVRAPSAAAAAATAVAQSSSRIFRLVKPDTAEMQDLRGIFEKVLVPLYGSQEDALSKIGLAKDRVCHLLYEDRFPMGVIAFKTQLSSEFQEFGISDSIEIKSLFVVESENNSGKGIGSMLLDKVATEVHRLQIPLRSTHVTVSATKIDSLTFFRKKGFRIVHSWNDKYIKGAVEHLLCRDKESQKTESEQEVKQTNEGEKPVKALQQQPKAWSAKLLRVVPNAHWDDVHGIKLLSDGTFVTGSKDNTLRKWNREGAVVREVLDVEPRTVAEKERNWITAIGVINDCYWVSANRSGTAYLWSTAGDYIKELKIKLPSKEHVSLENNKRRINCLVPGLNKQAPSFFAGFPTLFSEYNLIEGRTVSTTKVHNNDWVYCVHPLTEQRNLVVKAGNLELWEKRGEEWQWGGTIVHEQHSRLQARSAKRKERHHISALTKLDSSASHFGMGIFGGFVAVADIAQQRVIKKWHEHVGNVWAIENVSRDIFASSGDDGFIKMWDVRANQSISTLGKHIGRVSSLMRLDEATLVAGACPLEPSGANEGAQLLFYDIRR